MERTAGAADTKQSQKKQALLVVASSKSMTPSTGGVLDGDEELRLARRGTGSRSTQPTTRLTGGLLDSDGDGELRLARSVAVLSLVRHDEHRRVVARPLHLLPRRAALHAAAPVVAPEEEKRRSVGRSHGGARGLEIERSALTGLLTSGTAIP